MTAEIIILNSDFMMELPETLLVASNINSLSLDHISHVWLIFIHSVDFLGKLTKIALLLKNVSFALSWNMSFLSA